MVDLSRSVSQFTRQQEEKHAEEQAAKLKLPYIVLDNYPFTKEILDVIPKEQSLMYRVIPYLKIGKKVKVGAVDPTNEQVKTFLDQHSKSVGVEFVPAVISNSSFVAGIVAYDRLFKKVETKEEQEQKERESLSVEIRDIESVGLAAKKVSITRLLDIIVIGAIRTKASDIHMEPKEHDFVLRYRIDGVLQNVVTLPIGQFHQLLSRIKYLAQLRLDVTSKPQDGRFSVKDANGNNVDMRISLMPSAFGEAVVIRLLGQEKSILSLDKLGVRSEALAAIREAISKPHGMILTSGPTGSGKTSTLYAVLMELNKPGVKIITLEDPVEYQIEGIQQSQIRSGEGYEFADGLRASLRQDPDILMVGEIRDAQTGEIAVQAALTGHLLISTIHANSAPAVYVRMLEMGIKPFLLAGSINIMMAQRLVRKICPHCREKYVAPDHIWQEVQAIMMPVKDRLGQAVRRVVEAPKVMLFRGKGCEQCNNSGFMGRQIIIEVLVPNEKIENLVTRSASIADFEKAAAEVGMVTMEQDGLMKVIQGLTTVEEVWRVTKG